LTSLWTYPLSCSYFNLSKHWYPILLRSTTFKLLFITSSKLIPSNSMMITSYLFTVSLNLANPSLWVIVASTSVYLKPVLSSPLIFFITSILEVFVLNILKTYPKAPSPILPMTSYYSGRLSGWAVVRWQ